MEMFRKMLGWLRSEKGQTTIEYVLVLVLIAIVLVFAFRRGGVENGISDASNKIANEITNIPPPAP